MTEMFMKKIQCEICGSHKLKKENDVFVCQECGTEYSLTAAKQLLVDICDNSSSQIEQSTKSITKDTTVKDKNTLISILGAWYELLKAFETANKVLNSCYPYGEQKSFDSEKIKEVKAAFIRGGIGLEDFANSYYPYNPFELPSFDNKRVNHTKYLHLVAAVSSSFLIHYHYNYDDSSNITILDSYSSSNSENCAPIEVLDHYLKTRSESWRSVLSYCHCSISLKERPFGIYSFRLGNDTSENVYKDLDKIIKILLHYNLRPKNVSIDGLKSVELNSCLCQAYEYMDYYIKQYDRQYKFISSNRSVIDDAASLLDFIPAFSEMLDLPEKYRKTETVCSFIKLLRSDEAKTYQEIVSIIEKDSSKLVASKNVADQPIDKIDEKLIEHMILNGKAIVEALRKIKETSGHLNKFLTDYMELQLLPAKELDKKTGEQIITQEDIIKSITQDFELGIQCLDKKEYAYAEGHFRNAAEKGNLKANYYLGFIFDSTTNINYQKNDFMAAKFYKISADQGDIDSQYNLALIYERGYQFGGRHIKEPKLAFYYFKLAADQGHIPSQFKLGYCYETGKGVEQDYFEAIENYISAAEKGDINSQYRLGLIYEDTFLGLEDLDEAEKYFRLAADQGHMDAKKHLQLIIAKTRDER